jgi:hypothetical protein
MLLATQTSLVQSSNYAIKRDLRENTSFKFIIGRVGPLFWLLGLTFTFRKIMTKKTALASFGVRGLSILRAVIAGTKLNLATTEKLLSMGWVSVQSDGTVALTRTGKEAHSMLEKLDATQEMLTSFGARVLVFLRAFPAGTKLDPTDYGTLVSIGWASVQSDGTVLPTLAGEEALNLLEKLDGVTEEHVEALEFMSGPATPEEAVELSAQPQKVRSSLFGSP